METTCDIRKECPLVNIEDGKTVQVGCCIITKAAGEIICKKCDTDFKNLIIKEFQIGDNKKI